jgi:hypothetical protein
LLLADQSDRSHHQQLIGNNRRYMIGERSFGASLLLLLEQD